jgi:hypothetical protein
MKRGVAGMALFLSFVLPLGAQDAFTPLIYSLSGNFWLFGARFP